MMLQMLKYFLLTLLMSGNSLAVPSEKSFSSEELIRFASEIAPLIAGRGILIEERINIKTKGYEGFDQTLRGWTLSPTFPRVARQMVTEFTKSGGKSADFDANLPGNLAEYVAREKLPFSTLLTADSCYDQNLKAISCDTGAPYSAGLVTTRSYLKSHASRFNLGRAIALMEDFVCLGYPMKETFQPRDPMDAIIPLFARDSNSPENAPNSFGFGRSHCYLCHGQFSAHTQLFVRFDSTGIYRADASGIQGIYLQPGESGTSDILLFTSHFKDPKRSGIESSQMLGKPVQNLSDAVRILVETDEFKSCAVRRTIAFGSRLDRSQVNRINDDDVASIVEQLKQSTPNPSFSELFYAVFKNARVIKAMLRKS